MSGYSDFVETIANLCVVTQDLDDATTAEPFSDENLNQILPQAITYAEQRMYRELDLLGTFTSTTAAFTPLTRSLTVPGNLIVLQSLNVVTPAATAPTAATAFRNTVQRVSIEFLNSAYPYGQYSGFTGVPIYFAMSDENTIQVAPVPDAAYVAEFLGTVRPTPLSSTNTDTLLTSYCPDAFILCGMIFMSAYQKSWSSQADDPKMAQSYESQYQTAKASIDIEAARQKSMAPQWSPLSPTKAATPPRM